LTRLDREAVAAVFAELTAAAVQATNGWPR
jgi:hypothetical protein